MQGYARSPKTFSHFRSSFRTINLPPGCCFFQPGQHEASFSGQLARWMYRMPLLQKRVALDYSTLRIRTPVSSNAPPSVLTAAAIQMLIR